MKTQPPPPQPPQPPAAAPPPPPPAHTSSQALQFLETVSTEKAIEEQTHVVEQK